MLHLIHIKIILQTGPQGTHKGPTSHYAIYKEFQKFSGVISQIFSASEKEKRKGNGCWIPRQKVRVALYCLFKA